MFVFRVVNSCRLLVVGVSSSSWGCIGRWLSLWVMCIVWLFIRCRLLVMMLGVSVVIFVSVLVRWLWLLVSWMLFVCSSNECVCCSVVLLRWRR